MKIPAWVGLCLEPRNENNMFQDPIRLFELALGLSALMSALGAYRLFNLFKVEHAHIKKTVPRLGNHKDFVTYLEVSDNLQNRRESAGTSVAIFVGCSFFLWSMLWAAENSTTVMDWSMLLVLAVLFFRIGMGVHYASANAAARSANASRQILNYKKYIHPNAWRTGAAVAERMARVARKGKKGLEPVPAAAAQAGDLPPIIRGDFDRPVFVISSQMALEPTSGQGADFLEPELVGGSSSGAVASRRKVVGSTRLWEPESSEKAALALAKTGDAPALGTPVLVVWHDAVYRRLGIFTAQVEKVEPCDLTAIPVVTARAFSDITCGATPPWAITVQGKTFVGAGIAMHIESDAAEGTGVGWIADAASVNVLLNMLVFLSDVERQVLHEQINPGKAI